MNRNVFTHAQKSPPCIEHFSSNEFPSPVDNRKVSFFSFFWSSRHENFFFRFCKTDAFYRKAELKVLYLHSIYDQVNSQNPFRTKLSFATSSSFSVKIHDIGEILSSQNSKLMTSPKFWPKPLLQ